MIKMLKLLSGEGVSNFGYLKIVWNSNEGKFFWVSLENSFEKKNIAGWGDGAIYSKLK